MSVKLERAIGWDGGQIQQRPDELEEFRTFAAARNVRTYLEIGLQHGRTFHAMATILPAGTNYGKLRGVDIKATPALDRAIRDLRRKGFDAEFVAGDSRSEVMIKWVQRCGPYDLIFIDGDHSVEGVRADWENYSPLMSPGGAVAFHDIDFDGYGVKALWEELKASGMYETKEIIGRTRGMGIGVLWRTSNPRRT